MTYHIFSSSLKTAAVGFICSAMLAACASGSQRDARSAGPADTLRSGGSVNAVRPIGLLFASMDQDGQIGLDMSELEAGIAREWTVLNAGVNVSANDYANWSLSVMGSRAVLPNFMSFDKDFNGGLSEGEFERGLKDEFKRADQNKDGRVTRDETVYQINMPRQRDEARGQNNSDVEQLPRQRRR